MKIPAPATNRRQALARRKKWYAALREDGYGQARGALARKRGEDSTPSFCCLGVACVVAGEDFRWQSTGSGWAIGHFGFARADSVLPDETMEWLGFTSRDPLVNLPDDHPLRRPGGPTCSGLNDIHRLSFPEIADLLEEYGIHPRHDRFPKG